MLITAPHNDSALLQDFTKSQSPSALTQLIEQHIDFVHATALRQTQNAALAEDITQAVFLILAKKANSIHPKNLTGWLFNTTRYCAANARRAESRRHRHERQAAKPEMQMQTDNSLTDSLNDALAHLRTRDREVVLLRYLQQREFPELSSILGISEQTARQRLSRALERLRRLLGTSGQILPAAIVTETLSTAIPKAPAHLTHTILTAIANHTVASATASELAIKTIQMLKWMKIKIAASLILAAAITGGAGIAVVKTISAPVAVANSPAPPAIAPPTPPASTTADFSDGLHIELLGAAPGPVHGEKWWKPDGSPLDNPPYNSPTGQVSGPFNTKPIEFALKITGTHPDWDINSSIAGSAASSSSERAPNLRGISSLTPSAPTVTLNVVCATGPWQTITNLPADTLFKTGIAFHGVTFSPGNDKKLLSISVDAAHAAISTLFRDDNRFIAIDLNGNEHSIYSMRGVGGIFTETKTFTFNKLRADQVKEFQIRTRPFNHIVEFQNISIIPGQITTPTVAQHDTGKFIASFTAGGTAEVVGISTWPTTNWWQPDGTPLTQIPPDYGPYTGRHPRNNEKAYAVAIKLTDTSLNPSWIWDFPGAFGIAVPAEVRTVPPGSPDVYRIIVPATKTTTNFRVGLAGGPSKLWPTVISTGQAATVKLDDTEINFAAPAEINNDLTITVTDNLPHNLQRQLVVIDTTGVSHIGFLFGSNAEKSTFRFQQLKLAQLKSLQLQTREYEYVNFKNLPLSPAQKSNVTIESESPAPQPGPTPAGHDGL